MTVFKSQCLMKQKKLVKRFLICELQKFPEFKDFYKSFKNKIRYNLRKHKNYSFMNSVLNGITLWKIMSKLLYNK